MIKNFIVDRVVRANMYSHADGSLLWGLNQIQSPSLNMESETVEATDALGTPIMSFDRSKTCTFSAENAIFDMGLLAEQVGTEAVSEERKVPVFETIAVKASEAKLAHVPADEITYVYVVNGDGSLGTEFKAGTDFTVSGQKITFITTVADDTQVFVSYEYVGKATYVMNSAKNFPKAGKFVMEVLGRDVCDSTTEIYAMLILPNAKLSASTDISFETEMTQGFELTAQQNYCSATNELFTLIIPE
jgi:hypothetical protein